MLTLCPKCDTPLATAGRCPRCEPELTPAVEIGLTPQRPVIHRESWQQTPGGRVLVGVLLAVGLGYGLMQLTTALFRALGVDAGVIMGPAASVVTFEILKTLGIAAGGVLAGIGQRRGLVFGAMVGALSGLLFIAGVFNGLFSSVVPGLAAQLLTPGTLVRNIALYGLPILYTTFGGAAGWLGSHIWQPLPGPSDSLVDANESRFANIRRKRRVYNRPLRSPWDGPVMWARVAIGALVAVCGAIYTKSIIDFSTQVSEGKLSVVTLLQDQVTYAEVFSLAIMIGGCIAGANTYNGLKQGMCVGIAAAFVIDALFIIGFLNTSAPAIYPVLSTLFLGPVGGWFGSELLPPVYQGPRRRRATWFRE
jgi:hypothetical protein